MTTILRGVNRELQVFLRELEKEGWEITTTNGGHFKIFKPNIGFVICGKTSGDRRSIKNTRSNIRRLVANSENPESVYAKHHAR